MILRGNETPRSTGLQASMTTILLLNTNSDTINHSTFENPSSYVLTYFDEGQFYLPKSNDATILLRYMSKQKVLKIDYSVELGHKISI